MLKRKAYTIAEILTVMAIIIIITGAVSLGINSFGLSAELMNTENTINMQLRSNKIGVLSGEIECSNLSAYYKKAFFTSFNSIKEGDFCKREFIGQVFVNSGEVYVQSLDSSATEGISVFASDDTNKLIDTSIRTLEGNQYIVFSIDDSNKYIIKSELTSHEESMELVFYNDEIMGLEPGDPKYIYVQQIKGTSFKKYTIYGNKLDIIIATPNPLPKSYIDNIRVKNTKINMSTGDGEEENEFLLYGANLIKIIK